jgi:hypothetical protein
MGKNENQYGPNPSQERCTPRCIWEPIVEHFGSIGLDPFGCPEQSLPAKVIFSLPPVADKHPLYRNTSPGVDILYADSRELDWHGHGLVFCNGPWNHCEWWTKKAGEEADEAILLVPARMNNVWLHEYIRPADAHYIPKRRIIFENCPQTTPPFHIMLAYWGNRRGLFKKCFASERDWWFL